MALCDKQRFQTACQVAVTINDQLPAAKERIAANAATNNLHVTITTEDVSVLLLQRPFDFV